MRLLHTSDWHLGRSFHGVGLLGAQAAWVDHLVEVVRSQRIDAVLVAGDVFDRAIPPIDAVALWDEALWRLRDAGARVVVSSGNHDSPQRLGAASRLVESAGVHVRTDPARVAVPVLLDGGATAVYPIPYLEPDAVHGPWALPRRSHAAALAEACLRIRTDLAARRGVRSSVVLAHAFVTGAAGCDSERDIRVGGLCDAPVSVFDGFDYVALGHLHGQQRLRAAVAYAGSPLAFSFSETAHRKGSWLVELTPGTAPVAERVDAPVPRRLHRVRGRLDVLLGDAALRQAEGRWVEVTLTDPVRPPGAMDRLRQRFPHTLSLRFDPDDGAAPSTPLARRLAERTPVEIATAFVEDVCGAPAAPAERCLLDRAVTEGRQAEAAA